MWTAEQLRAINEDGNLLVSAAAGAGKTAVMTERIARIIASGTDVSEILVVTFTNPAAAEMKQRIVQELVPGKQISLAHIIANPDKILYTKLGLDPSLDYSRAAIGIMTVSPAETAIIMADIAMKSSGIELGFVDRFSGSLIITGTVSEVEASTSAILDYVGNKLGFTLCPITRT